MRRAAGEVPMSAATSNSAALYFVTALVVLLALMLTAVLRLPEWQPKTTDGSGGPLLPPEPAQPVPSLFRAGQAGQGQPAEPSRLPHRAAAAGWTGVAARTAEAVPLGRPGEAGPVGGPGEVIPLGAHGRLSDPALLGEAGARPGDPGYAARRDREQLGQATVGRVVVPGSPPWGPAPKPPGIA
jgi:hypothetical protein